MASQHLWLKVILVMLQAHLTIVVQWKYQTGINTDTFDFSFPFYQSQLQRQSELIFFTLYEDNVYNVLVCDSPESDLQQHLGVVCGLSYKTDHLIVRLQTRAIRTPNLFKGETRHIHIHYLESADVKSHSNYHQMEPDCVVSSPLWCFSLFWTIQYLLFVLSRIHASD